MYYTYMIYYQKLAHVIKEAKFQDLLSADWRPRVVV